MLKTVIATRGKPSKILFDNASNIVGAENELIDLKNVSCLVLVKDENLPPMRWPLGRVVNLISGKDGVSRVADVRTTSEIIRRAVNKLCLLPLKQCVASQAPNGWSILDFAVVAPHNFSKTRLASLSCTCHSCYEMHIILLSHTLLLSLLI